MTASTSPSRRQPARSLTGSVWSVRPERGPIRGGLVLAALVTLTVAGCTSTTADAPVVPTGSDEGIATFSEDSPWYSPIPADPVVDEDSDAMVGALTADGGTGYALLEEYGVPVFETDEDTLEVSVTCTEDWGDCPVEGEPVRMPDRAEPSPGTDAAMVVIDREAGRVYDFWQAERTGPDAWTVSWGTWEPTEEAVAQGTVDGEGGGATGAGTNLFAGLIRVEELESGQIDHALALTSDTSCPDVFRYPALKTDGHASETPCVPQGARVQLDPSIDVSAIPGITPAEVTVARALQTYGGYLRDSSGTALGVVFETPPGGSEAYASSGLQWDYYNMPEIPWGELRVLAHWDGS